MKKLLLLFLVLLCACSSEITKVYSEGEIPFGEIHTFTYKNHTYICFKKDSSYSIIHDPECKFCYDIFDLTMIKNPPKEIEVFISVTLSKTLKIKVSDSNYNLYKEVEDQIILPQNAYDYIKGSELDTLKAQSLKEWDVDEIIIDNG